MICWSWARRVWLSLSGEVENGRTSLREMISRLRKVLRAVVEIREFRLS